MRALYKKIAVSDHWAAKYIRAIRRGLRNISVPAPNIIVRPVLYLFLVARHVFYFVVRVLVCEPFFKAYCTQYGKNLHTGVFIHWVQGRGRLMLGDNVTVDGKCTFVFAVRYTGDPTMTIGDNSGIGHACSFVVGDRITIGKHCRIAAQVSMFDAPGHPVDPVERLAGAPASAEDVRPIVVEDNVWIGSRSIIYPGVTIGENSVVAMGSVVMSNVPPNAVVAGNPARQIRAVKPKTDA